MTLQTTEQLGPSTKHLKRRRRYLGASDMPAVFNLDPWRNAYDLWLDKTGQLARDKGNKATEAGNLLEPVVLEYAAQQLGVKLKRNQWRVHENKIHAATLDAIVLGKPEIVQGKTAGLHSFYGNDEYGDEWTDQVPERIIIQVQSEMLVANAAVAWIPALIGGRGFCMFRVARDDELCDIIRERGEHFWREHVLADVPPPDVAPSLDVLKRMRREPNSTTELDADLVARYQEAKRVAKAANDALDSVKAELIAALGNAEAGVSPLATFTYLEQSKTKVDAKALKRDHPDLYEKLAVTNTYRVLREKKGNG